MILHMKTATRVDGVDGISSAYLSQDPWLKPRLLKELDGNFSRHNPSLVLAR